FSPANTIIATIIGTATQTSQDSPASSRKAITTPPTAIMGASTSMLMAINITICNCWTSLVARVISVAGPNWDIWWVENPETRRKMAARRSRPIDIATRAENHTEETDAANCTRATANMMPPNRQMVAVSPVATPSSIILALRAGKKRIAPTVRACSAITANSWPPQGRAKRAKSLSKGVPTGLRDFYGGPFIHVFIAYRYQVDGVTLQLSFGLSLWLPAGYRFGFAIAGNHHNRDGLRHRLQVALFRLARPCAHYQIDGTLSGVHDAGFDFDNIANIDALIKLHPTSKDRNRRFSCPTRRAHKSSLIQPVHQGTTLQTETRGDLGGMGDKTQ